MIELLVLSGVLAVLIIIIVIIASKSNSPQEYWKKTHDKTEEKESSKSVLFLNKKYLLICIAGFLFAFIIMVVIEHFGNIVSYKWMPDKDDKFRKSIKYHPSFYSTFKPFKKYGDINSPLFDFYVEVEEKEYYKSLRNYFDKSTIKGYGNCLKIYIKAALYDFKYLLLFWMVITGVLIFFNKFNLRLR